MWKKLSEIFDARDLYFYAGLGLFTAGLWQVDMTLALIGTGSVLLFVAVRR